MRDLLLPMNGNRFLRILTENSTEYDQKQQQKIANFADLLRNDDVFMQENRAFKKYQLRKKFIFNLSRILPIFRSNNGVLMKNKIAHLKSINREKNSYFGN